MCSGNLRGPYPLSPGVLSIYDADAIENAASTENEKDLYQRQLDVFLDPNDPKVIEQALERWRTAGVTEAAQQSPVYKNGDGLEAGPAAAPGISHLANGLARAAAVADSVRRRCG